jgi:hypothetical protein
MGFPDGGSSLSEGRGREGLSHLYYLLYRLPEFYRRTSLGPISEIQGIYILEPWIILECSGMYL